MTIERTGSRETAASDSSDALQQNGVQTQGPASDTTVLITQAEVAVGTAAATGVHRKERRWVALLRRIFGAPKELRVTRRPYRPQMSYLKRSRMAREMDRL
jgi:hypothetical protein